MLLTCGAYAGQLYVWTIPMRNTNWLIQILVVTLVLFLFLFYSLILELVPFLDCSRTLQRGLACTRQSVCVQQGRPVEMWEILMHAYIGGIWKYIRNLCTSINSIFETTLECYARPHNRYLEVH